jgi:hypothetical protein
MSQGQANTLRALATEAYQAKLFAENLTAEEGAQRIEVLPLPVPARARPALPQELAATFLGRLDVGFVEVFRLQKAAIARNES